MPHCAAGAHAGQAVFFDFDEAVPISGYDIAVFLHNV